MQLDTSRIVNLAIRALGQLSKIFKRKIVIIFLPISLNICFGCSKNRLIETVLLSTHSICFG